MRICHVITKPELGGAQVSTLNLVSNLPKDRYNISVITSYEGLLKPEFQGIKDINSYFSPFLIRSLNPMLDIFAFIHIYLIYRRNKYEIVHTHSSKAGIIGRCAAKFARVPHIIHTVHGWSFNEYQPIVIKWLFIFLERLTGHFTTRIICVSNHDIDAGLRYRIAPKDKFALVKYGIQLDKFKSTSNNKEKKKKDLGIDNNDPVVGMIACLKPQKAPLDYIRASIDISKQMPDVNFLLVGDGILKNRCKKELANSLHGISKSRPQTSIHFNIVRVLPCLLRRSRMEFSLQADEQNGQPKGWVPEPKARSNSSLNSRFIFTGWRRDVSEILDIIDLAVLTSRWEGMPIAIIEALSKGRPVVATDIGGSRELVKDGITGYLTKPGDYRETARKVTAILKDKDLLARMSREAERSIDDSFDIKKMVNSIDSLYRSFT